MNFPKNKYLQRIENLGFTNFLSYTWHQKTKLPKSGRFILASKHVETPLTCRGGSSDIDVFKHIYVIREYSCLDGLNNLGLVIDCGANGGFSTVYLLNRFPLAKVIAIEPDPGNFEILLENVSHYGDSCEAMQVGVWSKTCGLMFSEAIFGDGREWARSVREACAGETPAVSAVDIGSVLAQSEFDRISLLKIDIEGSESAVFSGSHLEWIDRVDNIIIELHGDECSEIYLTAANAAGFESRVVGGLMLSQRY